MSAGQQHGDSGALTGTAEQVGERRAGRPHTCAGASTLLAVCAVRVGVMAAAASTRCRQRNIRASMARGTCMRDCVASVQALLQALWRHQCRLIAASAQRVQVVGLRRAGMCAEGSCSGDCNNGRQCAERRTGGTWPCMHAAPKCSVRAPRARRSSQLRRGCGAARLGSGVAGRVLTAAHMCRSARQV